MGKNESKFKLNNNVNSLHDITWLFLKFVNFEKLFLGCCYWAFSGILENLVLFSAFGEEKKVCFRSRGMRCSSVPYKQKLQKERKKKTEIHYKCYYYYFLIIIFCVSLDLFAYCLLFCFFVSYVVYHVLRRHFLLID